MVGGDKPAGKTADLLGFSHTIIFFDLGITENDLKKRKYP